MWKDDIQPKIDKAKKYIRVSLYIIPVEVILLIVGVVMMNADRWTGQIIMFCGIVPALPGIIYALLSLREQHTPMGMCLLVLHSLFFMSRYAWIILQGNVPL